MRDSHCMAPYHKENVRSNTRRQYLPALLQITTRRHIAIVFGVQFCIYIFYKPGSRPPLQKKKNLFALLNYLPSIDVHQLIQFIHHLGVFKEKYFRRLDFINLI